MRLSGTKGWITVFFFMVILLVSLPGCDNWFGDSHDQELYSISGQVTDAQGNGVEGVKLIITGDSSSTVTTKEEGYWTAKVQGTVTVKVCPEGALYDPPKREVSTAKKGLDFQEKLVVKPEVSLQVKGIEFGSTLVYQVTILDLHGLSQGHRHALLFTETLQGEIKGIHEAVYGVSLSQELTLVILDEENRIIASTLIPFGNYEDTFVLEEEEKGLVLEDTSAPQPLSPQAFDDYLAEVELNADNFTHGEAVTKNYILKLKDEAETDLDTNYFIINDVAVEFGFAYGDIDKFNQIFTSKFAEVDYNFGDLNLYVNQGTDLVDAKTGDPVDVDEADEIRLSIFMVHNSTHPNGLLRPSAQLTVEVMKYDNMNLFIVTVHDDSVKGVDGAKGFTILKPTEDAVSFGEEIMRNTDSPTMKVFILGDIFLDENPEGFAGGSGTDGDPFLVATAKQLDNVRNYRHDPSFYFKQVADIDLSSFSADKGFKPIGSSGDPFQGNYDGNGLFISNLTINRPETNFVGLFGYMDSNAVLKEITLKNIQVRGNRYVGGLVGMNDRGTITNCDIENGEVEGEDEFVGGLVGVNQGGSGEIENCHVVVDVTGAENSVGGLVGLNKEGEITDSSSEGLIVGHTNVGGLVGFNLDGEIEDSLSAGLVQGLGNNVGGLVGLNDDGSEIKTSHSAADVEGEGDYVGGLVGMTRDSSIENCSAAGDVSGEGNSIGGLVGVLWGGRIEGSHATGNVTGDGNEGNNVGGLVGYNWPGSEIDTSYSTSQSVRGNDRVGGLVGRNDGAADNSYYDGGTVEGRRVVGLLVGVNWEGGEIDNCSATGVVRDDASNYGLLVGRNDGRIDNCNVTIPEDQVMELIGIGTVANLTIDGPGKLIVGKNIDLSGVTLNVHTVELAKFVHLEVALAGAVSIILLGDDITLEASMDVDREVTIDLAGYKLEDAGVHTLAISAAATIKDGTINTDNQNLAISGAATFEEVEFEAGDLTITADVVFDDVTLTAGNHTTTHKITLEDDLTITAGDLSFEGAATAELDGGGNEVNGAGTVVFNHADATAGNVDFDVEVTVTLADSFTDVEFKEEVTIHTNVTFNDVITNEVTQATGAVEITVPATKTWTLVDDVTTANDAFTIAGDGTVQAATGENPEIKGDQQVNITGESTVTGLIFTQTITLVNVSNGVTFSDNTFMNDVTLTAAADGTTFSEDTFDSEEAEVTLTVNENADDVVFTDITFNIDSGNTNSIILTINESIVMNGVTVQGGDDTVTATMAAGKALTLQGTIEGFSNSLILSNTDTDPAVIVDGATVKETKFLGASDDFNVTVNEGSTLEDVDLDASAQEIDVVIAGDATIDGLLVSDSTNDTEVLVGDATLTIKGTFDGDDEGKTTLKQNDAGAAVTLDGATLNNLTIEQAEAATTFVLTLASDSTIGDDTTFASLSGDAADYVSIVEDGNTLTMDTGQVTGTQGNNGTTDDYDIE